MSEVCDRGKLSGSCLCLICFVYLFQLVPLEISPRIQDVDISQLHIGEVLTVGCPVDTCTEEVAVTFLRGDDVVGTTVLNHTQKIHKLNLVVDERTAGMYACKVDINGATIIQRFTVTGTYVTYEL